MRRRILFAILGTVLLSLVLAGTGTYLLLRREAVRTTEASVRAEAEGLVSLVAAARDTPNQRVSQQRLVSGYRLEGIAVLVRGPGGVLRGELPEGLDAADIDAAALAPGQTQSGRDRHLTWAAATEEGVAGSAVTVVVTRQTVPPAPPVGWYFLAGGLALAIGAAVAAWLSDTLTRPLRQASAATARIAAGDLTAPLPAPDAGAHDEVADLARSINAMAAALSHSRGLERQFILSVSHDLRTPLTSIRGYADAITDGTIDDPVDGARIISAEAQRLGRLVGDLLDLARLDAHEFSFHLQPVPVNEVVTEAVEGFRPTADATDVALELDDAAGATVCLIDPDRLAQAVANLLENALKYALSTVTVVTRTDERGVVTVEVIDDGPGIAPADVAHVFERLYVADRPPRRQVGGTGLGLAIVHEVVTGMGGSVAVTSPATPDGRGARFAISLPPAPPPPPG